MSNKNKFLVALGIFAGAACLVCALACSRYAPRGVQHQREAVFADARTVMAALRYLASSDQPALESNVYHADDLITNLPQAARLEVSQTNLASLTDSNQWSDSAIIPAARS